MDKLINIGVMSWRNWSRQLFRYT